MKPLPFLARASRLALGAVRERRLPLSPGRWLVDLRHLHGVMATERSQPAVAQPDADRPGDLRAAVTRVATTELHAFLASGATLRWEPHADPLVSVVIVLFNRAELTLRCLRSLRSVALPVEVVLVDNASTDLTTTLLERLDGVTIVRHDRNRGFGPGVNAGARLARGTYLLLLNSDAELLPGSLEAAIETATRSADVGAVGGRLILPDGSLQEAGSIIWNDGSCAGYGRGDSPFAPGYSFERDVDFCSGAFLLTPRALFLEIGGFDAAYDPAYYEDVDYCATLWEAGRRVVYCPRATAMHFEFASSGSRDRAAQMQLDRRRIFVRKHAAWLQRQPAPLTTALVRARDRGPSGLRILVFDDRVPHRTMGFGFPRALEMIEQLVALGHAVTLYPLSFPQEDWPSVYRDVPPTVEVMVDCGPERVAAFMEERRGYYDAIIVSRHHNLQRLRARLGDLSNWGASVIYDAEALSVTREVARRQAHGVRVTHEEHRAGIRAETELAREADLVLAVSDLERDALTQAGFERVAIVRHAVRTMPTARTHAGREGLLFVGAFDPMSPNADAVLWFVREVLPRVDRLLGARVRVTVAGHNPPREVVDLSGDRIAVVGGVADLTPLYDSARLFVAPTRFAAGIPLKVIHAAAQGLPVVSTPLLAAQLGWRDGVELLSAGTAGAFADACARMYTDADLWHRIREGALERVGREYTPEIFRAALARALSGARPPAPALAALPGLSARPVRS